MNRLSDASSAYLQSAAHQPVHWFPWGTDAFEEAARLDRPVLLDVGAVWCHWCHVMDRESYEDPALAELLNHEFVCIKVDRDERPDVDARYQRAVQALSGQGGWPLTAFLSADGEVFYGGTYFPPRDAHGRPAFSTILGSIASAWRERREDMLDQASLLTSVVSRSTATSPGDAVTPAQLSAALRTAAAAFDGAHGGFGRQPKFPHPGALRWLMAHWQQTGDDSARMMAESSLRGMARGGIHDQLGGGFHRYSVDAQWIVPHFEKMSYDNAELLEAYLDACTLWGDAEYRGAASGIAAWVSEVLAQPDGGYGASQDADVGLDDDGDYFTWTRAEAAETLPKDEFEVAAARWDIGTAGEMHHDPARNVLFQAATIDQVALRTGRTAGEVAELEAAARQRLLDARQKRTAPAVDTAQYAAWNAMLATAMLRAGTLLGDESLGAHALRTLTRMRERLIGARIPRDASGRTAGGLDDQVQFAQALCAAFQHTGDGTWLATALKVATQCWKEHEDPADGALTDIRPDQEGLGLLSVAIKPADDSPTPSGNGAAAWLALTLAALTGNSAWRDRAARIVKAYGTGLESAPLHRAALLRSAARLIADEVHLVVVGGHADAVADTMHRMALAVSHPYATILRVTGDASSETVPSAARAAMQNLKEPAALVCVGTACQLPAFTAAEWGERLDELAGRRVDG